MLHRTQRMPFPKPWIPLQHTHLRKHNARSGKAQDRAAKPYSARHVLYIAKPYSAAICKTETGAPLENLHMQGLSVCIHGGRVLQHQPSTLTDFTAPRVTAGWFVLSPVSNGFRWSGKCGRPHYSCRRSDPVSAAHAPRAETGAIGVARARAQGTARQGLGHETAKQAMPPHRTAEVSQQRPSGAAMGGPVRIPFKLPISLAERCASTSRSA